MLQVEVRKVNSGVDKYEKPCVDIHLRTYDFTAMTLAKYIATQTPATIKVVE
jgi:hypothetical protein